MLRRIARRPHRIVPRLDDRLPASIHNQRAKRMPPLPERPRRQLNRPPQKPDVLFTDRLAAHHLTRHSNTIPLERLADAHSGYAPTRTPNFEPRTCHVNHFAYFTEIEDRFAQRRGSLLLLSTLDWALIETWREAGVPLDVVLRGIDLAFDKHEAQRARLGNRRQRKVNGLAWCAQAVMEAAEQAREASVGIAALNSVQSEKRNFGFEAARIARYLARGAVQLDSAAAKLHTPATSAAAETAARLRALAAELIAPPASNPEPRTLNLEDLDRTLSVLEEKLFAAILAATPEADLVALREQAARELAPYRGKMGAVQIKQVQQQFLLKRLIESHSLPRLSLFYMPHEDTDGSTRTDS